MAGQTIGIRFGFRSGLEGSVGPDGSADNSALDGFAIDNITIRKRDVTFGSSTIESQQLSNLDLVAGESLTVQLTADFIDNTTYPSPSYCFIIRLGDVGTNTNYVIPFLGQEAETNSAILVLHEQVMST